MYSKSKAYPHNYYSPKATPTNNYYKGLSSLHEGYDDQYDIIQLENRKKFKYFPKLQQKSIEDFRSVGRRVDNQKYRGILSDDGVSEKYQ